MRLNPGDRVSLLGDRHVYEVRFEEEDDAEGAPPETSRTLPAWMRESDGDGEGEPCDTLSPTNVVLACG